MPTTAGDGDGEVVFAGHDRPDAGVQVAGGLPREVVDAEHPIDGEAIEEPVVDHRASSEAGLLRGLEDDPHGPVERSVSGQRRGRPQDHRHVSVVAAGVHRAVVA